MNRFLGSVSYLPFFAPDDGGAGAGAAAGASGDGGAAAAGAGAAASGDAGLQASNLLGDAGGAAAGAAGDGSAQQGQGGDAGQQQQQQQQGEQKTPEQIAQEAKAANDAALDALEIKVPEGLKLDDKLAGDFKAFAKEQGFTADQAQKLVDFQGTRLKEMMEAPYRQWADTQKAWQSEIQADAEIGGSKLQDNIAVAAKALDHTTPNNPIVKTEAESKALREALIATGAGNNPAVVRAFVRLGQFLAAEPRGFVSGGAAGAERSPGEILYGKK